MSVNNLYNKLDEISETHANLEKRLSEPDLLNNQEEYQKVVRRHAELGRIVSRYRDLKAALSARDQGKALLHDSDEDMAEMAREEFEQAEQKIESLESDIKLLLLPPDPNDEKNIIMEIRAGTGGEEAALFAADLLRMYMRFAEIRGWKVDTLGMNETGLGGIREVSIEISGDRVYSQLKFESGTHRVQRIPETEAGGRIHTSAVTVAVLPEAEDVDVELKQEDLRIDVYRSSGPGGQSVNTTDSAVRITHLPTNTVVSIQDEKSQHKNRDKALKVLRARLYEMEMEKQEAEISATRKAMVGTGDRSGRIRTYNFPQNRVTDHRINFNLHKLDQVLEGDLEDLINALQLEERAKKLELVE